MSNVTVADHDEILHLTYGKYVLGFVGSVILTLGAYLLATHGTSSKTVLAVFLAVFAIAQFVVQMVLFLHVTEERGTHWRLIVMSMMLLVVIILVFGSLWIMNNLNYRMMRSPKLMQQYLKSQSVL